MIYMASFDHLLVCDIAERLWKWHYPIRLQKQYCIHFTELMKIAAEIGSRHIVTPVFRCCIWHWVAYDWFQGLRVTLEKFDEEQPRGDNSISNRLQLMKSLHIEKLMKKNKVRQNIRVSLWYSFVSVLCRSHGLTTQTKWTLELLYTLR